MSNNEISGRDIILDFSYITNVLFKNRSSDLDQLIQKLEIKGISVAFEFYDFLRNSTIDKGYICLLNDRGRNIKKNDQIKVFDAYLRVHLDSASQDRINSNSQIGFVVEINPDNPKLVVKNIFTSNLSNMPQSFETQINGGDFIIMKSGRELSYEEVMRRGIINSSNIKAIKKINSNFSEVKQKWEQYINFSNDKLTMERNKAYLYFNLKIVELLKVDSKYNSEKLLKYKINDISLDDVLFLKNEAKQILDNNEIPYFNVYVGFALILEKQNKSGKKNNSNSFFKNASSLSLCPLNVNKNYNELETSLHDISKIYEFEYLESKDAKERAEQAGIPVGKILAINSGELKFINYWKKDKSIFLGNEETLKKYVSFNEKLMNQLIVKSLYFELDENTSKKDFDKLASSKSLKQGYFVDINIGEVTLLNRAKQTLDSIDKGSTKNPYLISYLFNTKEVRINSQVREFDELEFSTKLNDIQKKAVLNSVNTKDIYVIQGPPGTGKTQVITEITHQLSKRNKKVLITSQNHEAIDNVISRLPKTPDINIIRLINNEPFSKNKFAAERSVLNYYKTIHSQIENDINFSEEKISNAVSIKNELSQLILIAKSEYENNLDLKKIDDKINEINLRIKDLYIKIDEINKLNQEKSDLEFYADRIIEQLEKRQFDNIILSSKTLRNIIADKFGGQISKLYISMCSDKINEKDDEIEKLKKIYSSLCDRDATVKELDHLKQSLNNYNEKDQIDEINSKIQTCLTILNRNNFYIRIVSLLDEIVLGLKNVAEDNSLSKSDIEVNSLKDLIKSEEIKRNELLINRDSIRDKNKHEMERIELLARSLKENFDIEIDLVSSSLEEILNENLERVELQINNIKSRRNRLDKIYKQVIDFTNQEYDFAEEEKLIDNGTFSSKMTEETRKYSEIIISKLTNIYAMTLTSASRFNFNKNDVSSKLGINSIVLKDYNIDFVIIDEASKATAIEILMPLVYGKSLILVGDYRQLPPISKLKEEHVTIVNEKMDRSYIYEDLQNTLDNSLFKQVISSNNNSITTMLDRQYRSHSQISDVVNMFYDNQLKTDSDVNDYKKHMLDIKNSNGKQIIKENASVYWIDSSVDENDQIVYESSESYSTSTYNENEINITLKMVKKIDQAVKEKKLDFKPTVAVISFYNLHIRRLREKIKSLKLKNIKVFTNSVDNFQGKEADFVIVNIVRNPKTLTDRNRMFLKKYERINVAFSRARRLLIIVGAKRALENVYVDIPTVENPNLTNKKEIYADIIAKISSYSNILNAKDID